MSESVHGIVYDRLKSRMAEMVVEYEHRLINAQIDREILIQQFNLEREKMIKDHQTEMNELRAQFKDSARERSDRSDED